MTEGKKLTEEELEEIRNRTAEDTLPYSIWVTKAILNDRKKLLSHITALDGEVKEQETIKQIKTRIAESFLRLERDKLQTLLKEKDGEIERFLSLFGDYDVHIKTFDECHVLWNNMRYVHEATKDERDALKQKVEEQYKEIDKLGEEYLELFDSKGDQQALIEKIQEDHYCENDRYRSRKDACKVCNTIEQACAEEEHTLKDAPTPNDSLYFGVEEKPPCPDCKGVEEHSLTCKYNGRLDNASK